MGSVSLSDIFSGNDAASSSSSDAPASPDVSNSDTSTGDAAPSEGAAAADTAGVGDVDDADVATDTSDDARKDDKTGTVPLGALRSTRSKLHEEQTKRQALERELSELRGQISVYSRMTDRPSTQAQEQDQGPTDADLDAEFFASPAAALRKAEQRAEQRAWQRSLARSELDMRETHEDYDEAIKAYLEAARGNPVLSQQFVNNPHPARFAYQVGKTYIKTRNIGTVEDLEKKIEADLRPKIEAELRKKLALDTAELTPKSTAGARGSGISADAAWTGPTPIEDVFRRRR